MTHNSTATILSGNPFATFAEQTETYTLSYDGAQGWSAPFPKVDSKNTLVLVFAACEFCTDQDPLLEIQNAYPNSAVAGCGTRGQVFEGDLQTQSISVGIIRFRSTTIKTAFAPVESFDQSRQAGVKLAEGIADPLLSGVLLFADGLLTEATDLVRGIQEVLPPNIPIAGGMASDHSLEHTWVYQQGQAVHGMACAIGLIGDKVEMACATGGGWKLIGEERTATRTSHKTIFEIDGRPALDVYKEHIGPEAIAGLPQSVIRFPIALKMDLHEVVRDVMGFDEETGAMHLAGDAPQGIGIQFMTTTPEEILDGVDEAVERLLMQTLGVNADALCVCISCSGRGEILGDQTSEEPRLLQELLGKDVKQVGMYAFGEISTTTSGYPQNHNQTMTVAIIRER
ncbi:FIST N domain protein [Rubripirellula lacrimiformis]|uniref:FIST N domain protein n=1 Tax=Rubripirellula lacrimiformis TaxID=1930273 RepID=A0A517NF27_9BACT|nr:FIST N-terminal domain-containing protein [Rubripirellula lacrimiformis]QDT05737.1 FIST N domain protein [Rubripirellula lacrimiformis]